MPATILYTGYYRHPKVVAANTLTGGELAEVLWTRVLDHVNEHDTHGLIMQGIPEVVCPRQTKKRVDALVQVGLWEVVAGGWEIHDYYQWNRTAEEMDALRATRSASGKKGAEARWGNRPGTVRSMANGKALP